MQTLILIGASLIAILFIYKKVSPKYRFFNHYGRPGIYFQHILRELEDTRFIQRQEVNDKDNSYNVKFWGQVLKSAGGAKKYLIDLELNYTSEYIEIKMRMEGEKGFKKSKMINSSSNIDIAKEELYGALEELEYDYLYGIKD
jgi:hypothetical protein